MKPQWREFLVNAGAEFEADQLISFGNEPAERQVSTTGDTLCDLSHLGLIKVSGSDAQTFLQGQFSNDITSVDEQHGQLSAYCTPKGRMLAIFHIFRFHNAYYLQLPRELVEKVMKRLHMFVLRAQVDVEDASESFVRIGVNGPKAPQLLAQATQLNIPQDVDSAVCENDFLIMKMPGIQPRFEIIAELEAATRLWRELDVHAAPVGPKQWTLLDILAGQPQIYPETVELFIPQMTNLQQAGGLSFTKGCYPGQEIVARSQYLGKLKRRMYAAHVRTQSAPNPGDTLHLSGETNSGQNIGTVVSVAHDPDAGFRILAVVQISAAESGEVRLHDEQGAVLHFSELPYAVTLPTQAE